MIATRLAMRFHPLLVATGLLVKPGQVHALLQSAGVPPIRRDYPMNCRGGGDLVFVPIGPPSGTERTVTFEVPFAAGASAAGQEGQGLRPGTCAWVDRPMNGEEPRRVRIRIGITDSMTRRTAGDSGMYWSFLAHNSDSGYLTGVGYRYWNASWSAPARGSRAPTLAPASSSGRRLPFDLRYLPLLALACGALLWAPSVILCGMWSGWRRLAGLYPAKTAARGRRVRCGWMIMGLTNYRGGVRVTADDSCVHFSMGPLVRPGHPPFSVPWSDITVTRDGWPWFPMQGRPVIRFTLARHRALRILVPVSTGETLIEASAGRLQLSEPRVPAGVGH
jgi:hypothetical protein